MLRKQKHSQEAVLEAGWGVGWAEALKPWIICAFLHCACSSAQGISAPSVTVPEQLTKAASGERTCCSPRFQIQFIAVGKSRQQESEAPTGQK